MENLIGQHFNYWTVIDDAKASNADGHLWKCQCKCGTIRNVSARGLKSGRSKSCGCIKKITNKGKNIKNQRFGKLIAIKPTDKRSSQGSIIWRCKCDCGNECEISVSSLSRDRMHSCGCYNKDLIKNLNKKDLLNQKFGLLTVIEETFKRDSGGSVIWKCQCECGNIKEVSTSSLTSKNTLSCGCLNQSGGELLIEQILKENNIKFKTQYTNVELNKKRFDFAILDKDNNIIRFVEFDGQQHYNGFKGMWNNQIETVENIKKRDEEKNLYAKKYNIPLVRIPYWHKKTLTIDKILGDEFLIK